MVTGLSVGTDIIEIARVRKSCERSTFVERVYARCEKEYFSTRHDPAESMAGCWAAKEAFAKSIGTGVRGFELSEVAVRHDGLGCPHLVFSGNAAELVRSRGLTFSLSITHTKEYAAATVIAYTVDTSDER